MRLKTSALIALPSALLLALSLSACGKETATTASTGSSPSSTAGSSASSTDKATRNNSDGASAGSSSGADNARTVSIHDLQTGDCLSKMGPESIDGGQSTAKATVVDCAAPHQFEIVGEAESTATSLSEATAPQAIVDTCQPVLETYVGSTKQATGYRIGSLNPNQSSWDQGDHTLTCFLQAPDDNPLNKSAKDS